MALPTSRLDAHSKVSGSSGGGAGGKTYFAWRLIVRRLLPLTLFLAFVYVLIFSPPDKLRDISSTSSSYLAEHLPDKVKWTPTPTVPQQQQPDDVFATPINAPPPNNRTAKPRAAFVSLVRERNLNGMLSTIRDVQWAFNDRTDNGYDYIFLSEKPFTDWFKSSIMRVLNEAPSRPKAHFGLVDEETWKIPSHIDLQRAKKKWQEMELTHVPYGGSGTYRQMCRFYSGPIFDHPLLQDLDYIWRIEPDTRHLCRYVSQWQQTPSGTPFWLERDPFRYMREHKKKYAFVITLLEYGQTVRTLMVHFNRWRKEHANFIAPDNFFNFVTDNEKHMYNRCHFWTNFEIIDLSFVRSEGYRSVFKTLDEAAGFFYERWGDAPVRSIAASLLLNKEDVWHIDFAGYHHPPYTTCPRKQDPHSQCSCDPHMSVDYDYTHSSCLAKWDAANGRNSTEIMMQINEENGMAGNWAKDEEPYVFMPTRLKIDENA